MTTRDPIKIRKLKIIFVRHRWEQMKHPPYSPDLGWVLVILLRLSGWGYRHDVYVIILHSPNEINDPTPINGHAPFLKIRYNFITGGRRLMIIVPIDSESNFT